MKPEAQRIAIAEALNWPPYRFGDGPWIATAGLEIHGSDGTRDYPADLNAMHEAEKVLTAGDQRSRYAMHLCDIVNAALEDEEINPSFVERYFYHICPTAAQRAEAFLRTLNLWRPTQREGGHGK